MTDKDKIDIMEKIFSGYRKNVVDIHLISSDMAVISYDDRFWPTVPNRPFFGIAVKDGKAYGKGWHISSTVAHSFDEAILQALEKKYDGLNAQFARYAVKMLDIK